MKGFDFIVILQIIFTLIITIFACKILEYTQIHFGHILKSPLVLIKATIVQKRSLYKLVLLLFYVIF